MVLWGGVASVLLLWWSLLLGPSLKAIHIDNVLLQRARSDVGTARDVAGQILASNARPSTHTGDVVSRLDTIIKRLHIPSDRLKKLTDAGDGAQVQFQKLDGATLLRLIHAVQADGIQLDALTMRDFSNDGLWDVNLTVKGS